MTPKAHKEICSVEVNVICDWIWGGIIVLSYDGIFENFHIVL